MNRILGLLVMTGLLGLAGVENAARARQAGKGDPLLRELSLPPLGLYVTGKDVPWTPASGKAIAPKYLDRGEPQTKLREALHRAQVILWASSPAPPPRHLQAEVGRTKKEWKPVAPLPARVAAPVSPMAEKRLKDQLFNINRQTARMVSVMESTMEDLKDLRKSRNQENPRWQANYDLTLAWLLARTAYLDEHSVLLGDMRKEPPPRDPATQGGWRLRSKEGFRDVTVRKRWREADKLLNTLAEEHPNSPWAEIAQRARKTPLGLEWEAVK